MRIEESNLTVEEVLARWKEQIGADYPGYRNHVYRILNFCLAMREGDEQEREKLAIAACFHDLGIWAAGTFDYLSPSVALAVEHLRATGREGWIDEISLMIDTHHKLRSHRDPRHPLVELFRRGDLIDVSLGLVGFGIPRSHIRRVQSAFPDHGFHLRLVQLAGGWFVRHPLAPLPMVRW